MSLQDIDRISDIQDLNDEELYSLLDDIDYNQNIEEEDEVIPTKKN